MTSQQCARAGELVHFAVLPTDRAQERQLGASSVKPPQVCSAKRRALRKHVATYDALAPGRDELLV
jgi:hypothetical protein